MNLSEFKNTLENIISKLNFYEDDDSNYKDLEISNIIRINKDKKLIEYYNYINDNGDTTFLGDLTYFDIFSNDYKLLKIACYRSNTNVLYLALKEMENLALDECDNIDTLKYNIILKKLFIFCCQNGSFKSVKYLYEYYKNCGLFLKFNDRIFSKNIGNIDYCFEPFLAAINNGHLNILHFLLMRSNYAQVIDFLDYLKTSHNENYEFIKDYYTYLNKKILLPNKD
jgi:hypothetical protein